VNQKVDYTDRLTHIGLEVSDLSLERDAFVCPFVHLRVWDGRAL